MFVTLLRRPVPCNSSDVAISLLPPILGVICRKYSSNIPTSGDSGPGKNYRKKLKKETSKHLSVEGGDGKKAIKMQGTTVLHEALARGKKVANELLEVNTDSLLQQLEQFESSHEKTGDDSLPRPPTENLESQLRTGLKPELKLETNQVRVMCVPWLVLFSQTNLVGNKNVRPIWGSVLA